MGKYQRQARKPVKSHGDRTKDKPNLNRRTHSQPFKSLTGKKTYSRQKTNPQQDHRKVRFGKLDNILLVGEGDFSFAQSLVQHHPFGALVATCYDTEKQLTTKYPQTIDILKCLRVGHTSSLNPEKSNQSEWEGFSLTPVPDFEYDGDGDSDDFTTPIQQKDIHIHFGIDAKRLSSTHKKLLRSRAPYTKIVFNFPHVGGLSTDVNRQVRSNQELLVGFFNAAKPLLSTVSSPATVRVDPDDTLETYDSENENRTGYVKVPVKGQIMVTIFEGEPYTLWNIRDLARHCSLQVIESFRFPWAAYPGYQHARTIGNITSGNDRGLEGKRVGAWRGEERDARCYILEVKDDVVDNADELSQGHDRKRKRRQVNGNGSKESDSDSG